jgi:hypothetical protein
VYGPYVVTLLNWTPMFEGLANELRTNIRTTHVTIRLDTNTILGSIVSRGIITSFWRSLAIMAAFGWF